MESASSPSGPKVNSSAIKDMFGQVARRYDLANRVMSLGRDPFWRRALANRLKIVEAPGRLLDLAAGTGDQIVAAKKKFPNLEVTGLDLSAEMMRLAGPKFAALPGPAPEMLVGDALNLPFEPGSFDSVSISFGLRNIPDRAGVFSQVLRVLRPGGRFLVLEMYHDSESIFEPVVGFYLKKLIPFLGGRLISREKGAYRYLVSSIMGFPGPDKLMAEMKAAGFNELGCTSYTFNAVMLVWGQKPADGEKG